MKSKRTTAKNVLEVDLKDLAYIDTRIVNALTNNPYSQIRTLNDVILLGKAQLLRLPGFGATSLRRLEWCMLSNGIDWNTVPLIVDDAPNDASDLIETLRNIDAYLPKQASDLRKLKAKIAAGSLIDALLRFHKDPRDQDNA